MITQFSSSDGTKRLPPPFLKPPHDLQVARAAFNANCGPAALAAVLSLGVCDVMQLFPQFPHSPTTAPKQMRKALGICGLQMESVETLPDFGLALIAATGPWSQWKRAGGWTLRYTHWIGVCGQKVYDVNDAGWSNMESWSASVDSLFQGAWPKASGWSVRLGLRILPQEFCEFERLDGLVRNCSIRA